MISSIDEQFAPQSTRGMPIRRHVDRKRDSRYPPPSHPAATAEVGQLLDLGLALGHERFELVSLVGREEAGMIAAHAWASCGDSDSRTRRDSERATHVHDNTFPSRPLPAASHDNVRAQARREELRREVRKSRTREGAFTLPLESLFARAVAPSLTGSAVRLWFELQCFPGAKLRGASEVSQPIVVVDTS